MLDLNLTGVFHPQNEHHSKLRNAACMIGCLLKRLANRSPLTGSIDNFFPMHICPLTSPVWFVYELLIVCDLFWGGPFTGHVNVLFIFWILDPLSLTVESPTMAHPWIFGRREQMRLSLGADTEIGWRIEAEANWLQRSNTRVFFREWE